MITLYTWSTPNGRKISIALEELGLAYEVRPVDITRDEQFAPEFLALNPNHRIPVIVDNDGPDGQPITVIESGAILLYLAEKTGRLVPPDARGRSEAIQWLMFQMGGIGPMLGQAHHFRRYAPEQVPYAIERYTREAARLYGVLNMRLSGREWLAGGQFTVADIATYPWLASHEWQGIDLADYPEVKRWFEAVGARPAVARGMEVPR